VLKGKKTKLSTGLASLGLLSVIGFGQSVPAAYAAHTSHIVTHRTAHKTVTIGVATVTYNDVWLNYLRHAMEHYAAGNTNIKLVWANANNDSSTQLEQVQTFINEKVDSIVVVPVDPASMRPILNAVHQAKIPLITVNRQFPGWNGNEVTSYVGSVSEQAGNLEMGQIAKLLHGKGNIAVMLGQMGQEAEVDRLKGIQDVLKHYPKIHVILEGTASWNRAPALSLMENWLHSGKHIDALVSENDEMAIGGILAIKAAGLEGKILVGGTDGTPEGLSYVQSGELNVTVYQSALGQGTDSIKFAYEVGEGQKVLKFDPVPYEMVTKANVAKYQKVWQSLTK
jgi:inositol transport system substrate-binding protein